MLWKSVVPPVPVGVVVAVVMAEHIGLGAIANAIIRSMDGMEIHARLVRMGQIQRAAAAPFPTEMGANATTRTKYGLTAHADA